MPSDLGSVVRRSPMIRLFTVVFLALLLQIPVIMISVLISERQQRRNDAVEEVSSKWGRAQALVGPALVVPYRRTWSEVEDGKTIHREETASAVFLPDKLRITGSMTPEIRHRGIFSIPVYGLALRFEGSFEPLNWSGLGIDPASADWSDAYLALSITDTRAIQEIGALEWGGRKSPFLPGAVDFLQGKSGVHAPVKAPPGAGDTFSFTTRMNGTKGVSFAPFGKQTDVRIESSWKSPSFQGNWLPVKRQVSERGFVAEWSVPYVGRDFPQEWRAPQSNAPPMRGPNSYVAQIERSTFGLDLLQSVDAYRMANRSVKYAILFLLITLGAVWLAEMLARILVHPIQYLLLGAALIMFYLLELALSEHLGFAAAYWTATLAIVAMVGFYGQVVLGRRSRAAMLAGGVAALYGYLYVVLTNEDYALLVGAVGLFVLLAGVMFVTRRVNWFRVDAPPTSTEPAA
jgi:inner membrane protein